jgi:hypothetical protein
MAAAVKCDRRIRRLAITAIGHKVHSDLFVRGKKVEL